MAVSFSNLLGLGVGLFILAIIRFTLLVRGVPCRLIGSCWKGSLPNNEQSGPRQSRDDIHLFQATSS